MSSDSSIFEEPSNASLPRRNYSPYKLLGSLAILIFLAETVVMVVLYFLHLRSYLANTLLDGILTLVLVFPALYFLQLRPLGKKIQEQARMEMALRTSGNYLKTVLESLPVGVFLVNKNGNIVHGNRAGQEIWSGVHYVGKEGYVEYKGRLVHARDLIKEEEWAASRAIANGVAVLNDEISIEAFDGVHKIILNSAVPIFDEKNEIQGAVVVNQDITSRRQMEIENARANELLERFFHSIHTMIAYLDRDFNFLRVNQAYADGAGHPIEYFPGKNHFDLFPHEENETIFRRVVETGQPFIVFEKPFEYIDSPERGISYWDWSLQPVLGPDNTVEGLVFSLIDVTRRKQAEMQLERQNLDLRQLTDTEHRQRQIAESLVQSVIALNTSLDLNKVLLSVLEQTRKAISFQGADILLVEGDTWRVASYLGFDDFPDAKPDLKKSYPFDEYPLLQNVRSSLQMVMIDSVNEHPQWRFHSDYAWVRSFAAVPLIIDGNAMGIIDLYSERNAAFDQETAERLTAFAAQAALAIHNARLYQAESQARQIAETMRAAAQSLSQSLDFEQVIYTLLDHICLLLPCDTCGLTLLEGEGRWSLRALRGYNTWANQEHIPNAPLEEISKVMESQKLEAVFILPNRDRRKTIQNSDPEPIQIWAILPILVNEKVIGFVELGRAGHERFFPEQTQWAEALILEASVALQNAWLFEQVRSNSIRLQSLARKLVELQEKERYHIARELHDEAGQVLASMKIVLGRLEQDPDCPHHIRMRLLDLKIEADNVSEDLHRLAMDLRPVALDHLGLVAALEHLTNQMNCEGLSVKFKALGFDGDRLSLDIETSLYRIVQEALTNVLHHAQASNVGVLLERSKNTLRLFVEDDGIGFSPEQAEQGDQLGLVGMRERAEMLGGTLTIESSAGSGTSIIVEVPDVNTYSHHG